MRAEHQELAWNVSGGSAGQADRILATSTGLGFPQNITFETWERAGRRIAGIVNTAGWCLGDWLVFGQNRYYNRYRRAIEKIGLDYQTLRNYAWVARNVDYSRRNDKLSFQHHAEVAALNPEDQTRWLDSAARNGWSRSRLRQEIRLSRGSIGTAGNSVALPRLAVSSENVERWRRAASGAETDFEAWIVSVLDRAASAVLDDGTGDN
ncbi:LmbU family transcriptional regulator [Actinosynnema sp. NPDC050436]|uniref:LmbU family transcriptional regulator n=1 Tax=Actinosynnema sp. NPDC050436 TaxID=3155659 RepID=UPI0033F3EF96